MKKLGLVEVLEGIEDTRCERSVWYPLHEVPFIFCSCNLLRNTICKSGNVWEKQGKMAEKYINLEIGIPDVRLYTLLAPTRILPFRGCLPQKLISVILEKF